MAAAVKAVGEGFEGWRCPSPLPGGRRQAIDPRPHRQGSPGGQALHRSRRPMLQRRHRLHRLACARPANRWFPRGDRHRQRRTAPQLRGGDRHPSPNCWRRRARVPGRQGIIMGGLMMGFLVPDAQVPVVKATNCLIAHSTALFPPPPPEIPCIRCGECAGPAPRTAALRDVLVLARQEFRQDPGIQHLRLHRVRLLFLRLSERIPLVQYFRFAKSEIWAREAEKCRRRPRPASNSGSSGTNGKSRKRRKNWPRPLPQAAKEKPPKRLPGRRGRKPGNGRSGPRPRCTSGGGHGHHPGRHGRARVQRSRPARNIENLNGCQEAQVASVDARRSDTGGNENNQ